MDSTCNADVPVKATTSNVLLTLHFHDHLSRNRYLIIIYIFLILSYIGVFFGLLSVNFKDQEFIETNYYKPFHLLSFWAIFVFTILETLILLLSENIKNPLQIFVLFFDIVVTLSIAIMFTMYPEEYEEVAHYMEYSVQILISSVNYFFIFNMMYGRIKAKSKNKFLYVLQGIEIIVATLTIILSIFQLIFYSGAITTNMSKERVAHFCEFVNEILNGLFALIYSLSVYKLINGDLKKVKKDLLNMKSN